MHIAGLLQSFQIRQLDLFDNKSQPPELVLHSSSTLVCAQAADCTVCYDLENMKAQPIRVNSGSVNRK